MSRLDLRSVYADDVDDGAETPRGWLKRTKSLLTPRSSGANRRSPSRRDDGGGWEAVQVTGCHCHCQLLSSPSPPPTHVTTTSLCR